MVAVENTDKVHNLVVCTLCSCYPWTVLGLPPVWYKSAPYRSRAVSDPRAVLADFGVTLPPAKEIKVWDSTAEVRYLVLPERPAGTDGWNEERLAALVTRDSMIGTGLPKAPAERPMNGAHDMGGTMGFGPVVPEKDEPVFHAPWERRAFAITLAAGAPAAGTSTRSRSAREQMPPGEYLAKTYYEIWIAGLEKLLAERGLVTPDEIAAGKALHRAEADSPASSPRIGWPWLSPKAGRRRARQQRRSAFRSAIACAPAISIPPATRGFRVTCAGTRGPSRTCTAFMFSRTPTPSAAKTRSGSTRCASPRASSGARPRTRRARVSVDAWESYLEPK